MLIRLATPDDFARVGELTVAAYAPHTDGPTDFYIERLRDVASRAQEAEVWVAEIDGQVAGAVTRTPLGSPWREIARDDEAEFRMLAVDPDFQGRGVARSLVAQGLRCKPIPILIPSGAFWISRACAGRWSQ